MNFQKRKGLILSFLEDNDALEVKELAAKLNVSEITVRRDLNLLAEKGLIFRTHGGAANLRSGRDKVDFASKSAVRKEEKEYIGRLAANLIEDGDIVFMDCGSTVFHMVPFLKGKSARIVTNSLPVVAALLESRLEINLIGGEVDTERRAIHGAIAAQHISRYNAAKAFIGADGFSWQNGLSSNSEKEAEISLAMASQAKEVYLLCDSSKLEIEKYLQYASADIIDALITDTKAPSELVDQYRTVGLRVIN